MLAGLVWLVTMYELDVAGSYLNCPEGPGLTLDETFNASAGVFYIRGVQSLGLATLHPEATQDIWSFLPDHPPLGRLWLGLCHEITQAIFPPHEEQAAHFFNVTCARVGSASAFAALVFLVSICATSWYGALPGIVAGLSLVLMPRVFGHAHLASLETFVGLTYTAAALSVVHFWSGERPPTWKTACFTGMIFGLALLSKMQAVLLVVPIAGWAFCTLRKRSIVPLVLFFGTGLLVFFLGWPWLWTNPVSNLLAYFGQATDRIHLYTWYFGSRYLDTSVPWHYPWVMFLVTVPVGLHAVGFWQFVRGSVKPWQQKREQLILATCFFPLLVFSLPGVTVYDGARLFLICFPLWAILIGRGSQTILLGLQRKLSRKSATIAFLAFLSVQSLGLFLTRPCYLSYYNVLVGGVTGAEKLGLEINYWGDGVTRSLLEQAVQQVPAGADIYVSPVLHQLQLRELLAQSPVLQRHGVKLVPYDEKTSTDARYLLVFQRKADISKGLKSTLNSAKKLASTDRQGVVLAAIYDLSAKRSERPGP